MIQKLFTDNFPVIGKDLWCEITVFGQYLPVGVAVTSQCLIQGPVLWTGGTEFQLVSSFHSGFFFSQPFFSFKKNDRKKKKKKQQQKTKTASI